MNIAVRPARRLADVQEYYFSRKLKEVARLNAAGHDIVSLAIGCPTFPRRRPRSTPFAKPFVNPVRTLTNPRSAHVNYAKPWRASIADGSEWI